jgi:Inner membrane component of T3SS, cytoplasmic domain
MSVLGIGGSGPSERSGPAERLSLVVLSGPHEGTSFDLREGESTIGSRPACDHVLGGISPEHARLHLERVEEKWTLRVSPLGPERVQVIHSDPGRVPELPSFDDDRVAFLLAFRGKDDVFRKQFQDVFKPGSARMDMEHGDVLLLGDTRLVFVATVVHPARRVVGWLVALNGNHRGQDFMVREGVTMVGAGGDCDVVLLDEGISPRHAKIKYVEKDGERIFILTDLDSANGTYLNEQVERLLREELIDGDTVRFGLVKAKFKAL